jgi:hypothetical protein
MTARKVLPTISDKCFIHRPAAKIPSNCYHPIWRHSWFRMRSGGAGWLIKHGWIHLLNANSGWSLILKSAGKKPVAWRSPDRLGFCDLSFTSLIKFVLKQPLSVISQENWCSECWTPVLQRYCLVQSACSFQCHTEGMGRSNRYQRGSRDKRSKAQ